MVNKSSKCTNMDCMRGPVVPIYFRDEGRVHRTAFYICRKCNECTDFYSDGFKIPFLSGLSKGTLILRLIREKGKEITGESNRKRILGMKKNKDPCFECSKTKYERIFTRNGSIYTFVGYVCKTCKVIYMINFRNFRLKKAEVLPYKEFCFSTNPEIPEEEYLGRVDVYLHKRKKDETEEISITMKRKDIKKLRELLEKHNIEISSSSGELTPLPRSRS